MIRLRVNGESRSYKGDVFKRLIDVLREDLGLTGTKEGCGEGECGACTVLVDGEPVVSCLIPVCQMADRKVETVESLGEPESLNVLQEAFLIEGGAQCGICTLPWCTTPIEAESSLGPDSHHPIISLSGIPSAVMVLRILHPILASTLCAANPLARIAEPTIAL